MRYIPDTRNCYETDMPSGRQQIAQLLTAHLPKDLVLALEDGLTAGAARGWNAAKGMHDGHLPSVAGQMRHFHMNEAFYDALLVSGVQPTAIEGNQLVVGRAGLFAIGRFNTTLGVWNNGRRSRRRREMSHANRVIQMLCQPELFQTGEEITEGTVFFVAAFSRSLQVQPDAPMSISVAVPNKMMDSWLFIEKIEDFLKRYDTGAAVQPDGAIPILKTGAIDKQKGAG